MSIDVAISCWAKDMPHYAASLRYHLSSYCLDPPKVQTTVTVAYSPSDTETGDVLSWFETRLPIRLRVLSLPEPFMFRRAIARNISAKTTRADIIWMTDVDYVPGPGYLDRLEKWGRKHKDVPLFFTDKVYIHKTHAVGDACAARAADNGIYRLDTTEYAERRERRAWGGLQVFQGEYARRHGYPTDPCWLEPVDPAEGFCRCRGDVSARKNAGGGVACPVKGLYRIRHSHAGRDGGTVDHGAK